MITHSKTMAFPNYSRLLCNYSTDSDIGINLTCSGGEDGPTFASLANEMNLRFVLEEGVLGVGQFEGVVVMGNVDILSNPVAVLHEVATLKEDATLQDLTANLDEFEEQRTEKLLYFVELKIWEGTVGIWNEMTSNFVKILKCDWFIFKILGATASKQWKSIRRMKKMNLQKCAKI